MKEHVQLKIHLKPSIGEDIIPFLLAKIYLVPILCYTLLDLGYEGVNRADDITLRAESEEELKTLLMKVKEESEKVVLKLDIQKAKIMTSGSITSWEIDGETVETVSDFI